MNFQKIDLDLAGHSDVEYLNEPESRSRAGGHFFISDNSPLPTNNGAVLTISKIVKAVMSSTEEAKFGALFINVRETV